MKVAKNMDSVFANCTDDELDLDIFFDDDETIIDIMAGVDEAGNLITESFFDEADEEEVEEDEEALEEADDMVGEKPDFDYQNDGDASGSEKDAEGTKVVKPEIGGEVGDGKEVSGKENSAESNANDTKDEEEAIGMNDKQQVKLEDAAEGPLEDDDAAERAGEVSDTAIETESAIDSILAMLEADEVEDKNDAPEEDDDEKCCKEAEEVCPDCAERDGKVKHSTSNTEGESQDVLGAAITGNASKDPIVDLDDAEQRDGKAEGNDTEGVKTHVVGAALEASDDPTPEDDEKPEEVEESAIDSILAMLEADDEVEDEKDDAPEEAEDEKCCKEETECLPDDCEREGKVKHSTSNIEGESQDVFGASIVGDANGDPIIDLDDAEQRNGKAEGNDTEGVKTHVVGAALEASDDYLDDLLDSLDDDDDDIIAIDNNEIIPDSVKNDATDNADIKVDEAVEPTSDELTDDLDDDDIAAIANDEAPEATEDIEYDYDDDELIDAVINGDIDSLDNE